MSRFENNGPNVFDLEMTIAEYELYCTTMIIIVSQKSKRLLENSWKVYGRSMEYQVKAVVKSLVKTLCRLFFSFRKIFWEFSLSFPQIVGDFFQEVHGIFLYKYF